MKQSYKVITVCGDDAREDFLEELLADNDMTIEDVYEEDEPKNVAFMNSCAPIESGADIVVLQNPELPLGYILEFPKDIFSAKSFLFNVAADKILMFNRFPYRKRSLVVNLAKMLDEAKTIDSEVVLMKADKRFAATDIIAFEDTMRIAADDYAKIADRVSFYENGGDRLDLYDVNVTLRKNLRHHYLAAIDMILERFYSEFDLKYAAEIGIEMRRRESILAEFGGTPVGKNWLTPKLVTIYNYFLEELFNRRDGAKDFCEEFFKNHGEKLKNEQLQDALRGEINSKLIDLLGRLKINAA